VSDLCRLRTRFVHSNLEAFNPALLGPGMALIDWIYKPSIVHHWEVFIFHGLPAYLGTIWGAW